MSEEALHSSRVRVAWRWLVRAVLAVPIIAVCALFALWVGRRSVAAALAERYLAAIGVASSVHIERLDLHRLNAAVRLGRAEAPDATAHLAAQIRWRGLTPEISSVRVTRAQVRVQLDGRRVSFGAADPLIERLRRRSGGGPSPDVVVDAARLLVSAPQGVADLAIDASAASGALRTLRATLVSGALRTSWLAFRASSGELNLESRGSRFDLQAAALGRVVIGPEREALRVDRLQLRLEGTQLEVASAHGVHVAGHLSASADARGVRFGEITANDVALSVDLPTADVAAESASSLSAGGEAIGRASAHGLRVGFAEGGAAIDTAEATLQGRIRLDSRAPGEMALDTHASAHFSGALSRSLARHLSQRVSLGADPRLEAAWLAAARDFEAGVSGLHVTYRPGGLRMALEEPAAIRAATGAAIVLEAPALAEVREASRTARSVSGAFDLRVDGGGLPRLRVKVPSYAVVFDRLGRPSATAALELGTRLTLGPLEDLTVAGAGRLHVEGGRYTFVLRDCASVKMDALGLAKARLEDVALRVCKAEGPLLRADARQLAVRARWRSLSGRLPMARVAAMNGDGDLELARQAGEALRGRLRISSLQIVDRAQAPRFSPLHGRGTVSMSNGVWQGSLAWSAADSPRPFATMKVHHDQRTAAGEVRIAIPALAFAPSGLQPVSLSPLLSALRSAEGRAAFTGEVAWNGGKLSTGGVLQLDDFGFASPAGKVTHLASRVELTSLIPLRSAPGQSITVGEIGGVLPFTNFTGRFDLLPAQLRIESARTDFAGGSVELEPVAVALDRQATITATIRLQNVDLNQLVAASTLSDRITLDVRVSGTVPFSYGPAGVRVNDGSIKSTGPGRLAVNRSVWGATAVQANAVRDFAYQALEHLAVEDLDGKVDSLSDGRLRFLLHVKGRHDPPIGRTARVGIIDLLRGRAFDRPVALPKGTPIDLTLDSSVNFAGLLAAYRGAFAAHAP